MNDAIIITAALLTLSMGFVSGKSKGIVAASVVSILAISSSWLSVIVLLGHPYEAVFDGGVVFGIIPVRIDSLSAWFILIMNFTMVTGIIYGTLYLVPYRHLTTDLNLHYFSYVLNHVAMLGIYTIQNSLLFLCAWELMAVTSFMMVIFDHGKIETLKAGMNFLIQSHLCIVFLLIGFVWVSGNTGSYDFNSITAYTLAVSPPLSFLLFVCFLVAFGFKAGFVPFHTWLPYAHPAAPAHVSGVMSGVIIKLGIFGILRILLLMPANQLLIGYVILVLSLITTLYGVMLAIVQHNLKKLLAYHSIENIGIIGLGIGVGSIGLGLSKPYLAAAGFAGALLHTLNHSLFKSLLFYCAGTVNQATQTVNMEKLGGLVKKMPQTTALFLVGSLAITGVPPFNGFISEFMVYSAFFAELSSSSPLQSILMITAIFVLVVTGGLAILCFTKAFGIVFLGTRRHHTVQYIREEAIPGLLPKYMIAIAIIVIGILPQYVVKSLSGPLSLFVDGDVLLPLLAHFSGTLQQVSLAAVATIIVIMLITLTKKYLAGPGNVAGSPTWACGYPVASPKLQYTANSFVRSYRKLAGPLLMMNKKEGRIEGVFPEPISSETHPYDIIESALVDVPTRHIRSFMGRFRILQNGSVQFYVLYGVVFIGISIIIPLLTGALDFIVGIFRQI